MISRNPTNRPAFKHAWSLDGAARRRSQTITADTRAPRIGPEITVPADALETDQLVAYLGRRPWLRTILRALAEPRRRRILTLVHDGELPAGEIAKHFAITDQAVSQHLRVLKDAGLLQERRDGTRRLYARRPEAIEPVRSFLDDLWPSSLSQLKRVVEADKAARS